MELPLRQRARGHHGVQPLNRAPQSPMGASLRTTAAGAPEMARSQGLRTSGRLEFEAGRRSAHRRTVSGGRLDLGHSGDRPPGSGAHRTDQPSQLLLRLSSLNDPGLRTLSAFGFLIGSAVVLSRDGLREERRNVRREPRPRDLGGACALETPVSSSEFVHDGEPSASLGE